MVQPQRRNQLNRVSVIPGEVGALPKQAQSGDATTDKLWVVHRKPWPKRAIEEVAHLLLRPTSSTPLGNGGVSPPSGIRGIKVSPMPAVGQHCLPEGPAGPPDSHLSKPPQSTSKAIPTPPSVQSFPCVWCFAAKS